MSPIWAAVVPDLGGREMPGIWAAQVFFAA